MDAMEMKIRSDILGPGDEGEKAREEYYIVYNFLV
jgi:hypothetical protein